MQAKIIYAWKIQVLKSSEWVTTNKKTNKNLTVADCNQTPHDLVFLSPVTVKRKQMQKTACQE